jgi:uncharacterized membrane protein SirB2
MRDLHQSLALLTVSGFILRGYWMLRSSPLLRHPVARTAPHIIDTLFLATGIALVVQLQLPVLQSPWLLAKFAGLLAYIVLGTIALRRGRNKQIRIAAFAGALLAFAYVVNTAISKSPVPW